MSVLEIYINWVNSVLGETGGTVDGVEAVKEGKVLCDLIDVLAPDAGLAAKVKATGDCTPLAFIKAAVDHMKSHGIKIKFPAEDIIHNEIKSLLDILWILILNYGIHYIGQNAFQRSVGIGKKQLLEWCQDELGTTFDHRNTLTFNLCYGNWFVKLLEQVAGCSMQKSKDTAEYIDALLTEIQDRYCIMKDIIKANDIVDGTVDEHTLMIYLSLLRRRASSSERHKRRGMLSTEGKAAAMAKIQFFEKRARSLSNDSQRSKSADSNSEGPRVTRGRSLSSGGGARSSFDHASWSPSLSPSPSHRTPSGGRSSRGLLEQVGGGDGNETSDWSSTGSLFSGRERISPKDGAPTDDVLNQVISESVTAVTERRRSSLDDLVASAQEQLGKEAETQRISEKETDTLSEFSSSSLSRDTRPSLAAKSKSPRKAEALPSEPARPPRSRESSSEALARAGDGRASSSDESSRPRYLHQPRRQNGSEAGDDTRSTSRTGLDSSSIRISPIPSSSISAADRKTSTPVPRYETPTPPKDDNITIRIKRPKDYIHQWEDTIDRLSGVSVTDRMGSPRTPLISSYSSFKANGIPVRSRSHEMTSSSTSDASIDQITRRTAEITRRSRSNVSVPRSPQIVVSTPLGRYSNGHQPSSLSLPLGYSNGTISNDSSPSSLPAHLNRPELVQTSRLASVLDTLPPDMRQKAQEASQFLMQTSGPEIVALMDAIKQAREGGSSNESTLPKQLHHSGTTDTSVSEQTILKRRDYGTSPSQSSGARVRFEPQPHTGGIRSSSPLPPASPRLQSTSPHRLNGSQSPGRHAERNSRRMLSLSPRGQQSRSRSLSPGAMREAEASAAIGADRTSSPRNTIASRASLSHREDVLLQNLGMHSRVVEDERPSARLIALTSSSPRVEMDSPRGLNGASPHRSTERAPTNALYPEVTRLDLGLDSDRSFISHDDGAGEERTYSPPPVRRGTGGGGAGRVPRREAWELQRRRRGDSTTNQITDTDYDDTSTPEGQSRFIELLCREIDALKAKVDNLDEENARRSHSRGSHSSTVRPSDSTVNEDTQEEISVAVDRPQRYFTSSSTGVARSVSPGRGSRATSCPLLETSSRSPALSRSSKTSPRYGPHYRSSVSRPITVDTTISAPTTPLQRPSPASISPGIWDQNSEQMHIDRQENWKRLITTRRLTEQQTIELKQALACALVETDILTAKLNNARHDIHDKLHHTNSVLDDCRRHLAKSQAENQELRTKLEQERLRSAGFETRIREMEDSINEVKVNKQQLETELNQTASMLNRSISETKPGVDALKTDNARLVSRLAAKENDNDSLREEVHELKHTQHKAMLTMDELRECLSKVRRERQELFDEVNFLRERERSAKVRQIMGVYQEKGAMDEREREPEPLALGFGASTRNASFFESDDSGDVEDEDFQDIFPKKRARTGASGGFSNVRSSSPSPRSPRQRSHSHNRYFTLDDLSPSGREIYPHRKSYTPRSRSTSPRTRHDHTRGSSSKSPSRLPIGSSSSLIDQTLQEIERDMQRERETILSAANSVLRRPQSATYVSNKGFTAASNSSPSSRFTSTKRQRTSSRGESPPPSYNRGRSSPTFSTSHQTKNRRDYDRSNSPSRVSNLSRDGSADGRRHRGATGSSLNASFSSVDEIRKQRGRSGSPGINTGSLSARSNKEQGRATYGGHQSAPGSPARSPRYFPRTAHSPPTRLPPEDSGQTSKANAGGDLGTPNKNRLLFNRSGKGEIARSLQREFDKEDKLLSSLANSSVVQNKSWFEMQSESDGDDTGINSSMSSRSSCERPVTGRKKTPFLSDEQRRYADELIRKYTGNVSH